LRSVVAALLAMLYLGGEARAAERQLQVGWTQLSPQVVGKRIATVLTDGTTLEGKVVAVKPMALALEVKKTSEPTRFRGTMDIPRESVSTLRVSRPGWKWRVIGSLTGLLGGTLAGALIGNEINPHGWIISDGASPGANYGALGGAALGYMPGHFADRQPTVIRIGD